MLYMHNVYFQRWYMTSLIHPSSTVSKSVQIGENVKVGPFCNIDGNIIIGDGTELKSHVSITGNTTIGKNNIFYPFSNIGCDHTLYLKMGKKYYFYL